VLDGLMLLQDKITRQRHRAIERVPELSLGADELVPATPK
jgi:hypothetical protein